MKSRTTEITRVGDHMEMVDLDALRRLARLAGGVRLRDRLRQRITPLDSKRTLEKQLRSEIAGLPDTASDGRASTDEWNSNRRELREMAAGRDPRYFLAWPVLQRTMVVPSDAPYVVDHELPAVREAGWLPLLAEDLVGCPWLIPGTSTSGNLVHHAYHLLRFEAATGVTAASHDNVTEFGGGYGGMARLLYRLSGGRVLADIVDVPEFACLQRYFLRSVGMPDERVHQRRTVLGGRRLLIATWSLSEVAESVRRQFLEDAGPFDSYLLAYQTRFGEVDNEAWFESLKASTEGVEWSSEPIDHIPGNSYLFGTRPIVES